MPIVLTRATKQEARYKALGGAEHCSACRFYMPQGTCGRIIGPVSPEGWCKYYSREFVQRWQPGSAGGNAAALPPGATLDLGFMTPGTLDPRIVFTRASTGTYTDNTGTIRTAATNAPRWDYDPVTHQLRGLLIEEARTNSLLFSKDFSNAVWTKNAATTITPAFAVGLDGTTSAARVQLVSGGNQAVTFVHQNVSGANLGDSQSHTISVWARSNTGGNQAFALKMTQAGIVDHWSADMTVTPAWQRFSYTVAFGAGGSGFFAGLAPGAAAASADIVIWGFGLEQNAAFPTSYIPTTAAAVTRAIEHCSLTDAVLFGGTIDRTITVDAWAQQPQPGGSSGYWASLDDTTANNIQQLTTAGFAPTSVRGNITVAGVSKLAGGDTSGGTRPGAFKAALANGAVWNGAVNGVLMAGTGGVSQQLGPLTTLHCGESHVGTAQCDGAIQRVRYWPRALSQSELQQVTT